MSWKFINFVKKIKIIESVFSVWYKQTLIFFSIKVSGIFRISGSEPPIGFWEVHPTLAGNEGDLAAVDVELLDLTLGKSEADERLRLLAFAINWNVEAVIVRNQFWNKVVMFMTWWLTRK